jgi:hypothetical protein
MSRDALAGVYTQMLSDALYRKQVAGNPDVLSTWDLTAEEKQVLLEEARHTTAGSEIESGPVMIYLVSKRGPMLSPPIASNLGIAINKAVGLPPGALTGPGFLSNAACCPWGHAVIGKIREEVIGQP